MEIIDWNKIKNSQRNKINKSKPIFIFGPREISRARIKQLTKQLSGKRNLLWGCLKDEYIPGLENSPQFKSLKLSELKSSTEKLGGVGVLGYYQRDVNFIFQELKFSAVIFINGSWNRILHLRQEFWTIERNKIPYKLVSPFVDEEEAKDYFKNIKPELLKLGKFDSKKKYSDAELMQLSLQVAKRSFDNSAQIGVVLANKGKVLLTAHNTIVPYETYAMHNGYSKEKNFSPVNDQNHYDTVHAEMEAIIQTQKQKINLKNATLYINVMPCPSCARALSRTDISRIVYSHDHSEGYALKLFQQAGKNIERVVVE